MNSASKHDILEQMTTVSSTHASNDLAFLEQTAIDFVSLPSSGNIFQLAAEKLQRSDAEPGQHMQRGDWVVKRSIEQRARTLQSKKEARCLTRRAMKIGRAENRANFLSRTSEPPPELGQRADRSVPW